MLVTELGVKWKKADFRKGEQSQTGEAKTPSHPGAVPFELLLKPSCAFLVARLFRVNTSHLVFFTCAASSAISVTCKFTSAD